MGQSQPVDDATGKKVKEQAVPFPELDYSKPGYKLSLAPDMENIDGKDAYVISITSPSGISSKEYFDAATGLKIHKETTAGDASGSISFADYKEVNGIMFPFSETISQAVEIHLEVKDVKINSGLKDEDFK
jgi:hypothetical protein